MAERGRAQGRAGTWPGGTVAAPWLAPLPGFAGALPAALRRWAAAEVAPGRLMPWLPVGFGLGIVLYFTAEQEPIWWVTLAAALAAVLFAFLARARPVAFPVVLGIAAVAAGFATATVKARLVDHAILRGAAYGVSLTGFVERREEFERSDRIVLRVSTMEGERLPDRPERVRISVRKGTAPAVGSFVALKGRLNPPSSPFRPGGYDLARELYFQGIGATGLASGRITIRPPPAAPGLRLTFATAVEGLRDTIDSRIRATLKGDTGAIASALITGKRDALTGAVFDAMFVSGVGHVLSISGYHMALVAGVVFFFVRAVLALFPALALCHPIKKWAALAALAARHQSELKHRFRGIPSSSLGKPAPCRREIHRHTEPLAVKRSEIGHGNRVAAVRGLLKELAGFAFVLFDARAASIEAAETDHGRGASQIGGLAIGTRRLGGLPVELVGTAKFEYHPP
jgi:competence protein ComEC